LKKVVNPLYKLLPSKKLNLGGKNGATDLHPMASGFFFEFKKIRISVSAFYIAACLLCAASFFSCILLDLLCLNQLVGSLPRLFYFSSYSALWLLKISLASENLFGPLVSAATRYSWLLKISLALGFQQLLGALASEISLALWFQQLLGTPGF
jgi:hypothetical protein